MHLAAKQTGWIMTGMVILTAVLSQLPLPQPVPHALAFLLLTIWPTLTWQATLRGSLAERLLTAAGLALLGNSLLTLLLAYLPGELNQTLLLATMVAFTLWPLFRRDWRLEISKVQSPISNLQSPILLLLVAITAVFRFTFLGYSEFQGDESVILQRAAAILLGDTAELFLHQKGPMEILLPLNMWRLAGSLNEFWARLPFAWAGFLSVGAVYLLAKRWFDQQTGLLAAALFTIVGFSIAFSRIVQYQSLVVLWTALALLQLTLFRDTKPKPLKLILAALFLAGGLLAHYDAILTVPAAGWLLWQQTAYTKNKPWRTTAIATFVGATTLAIFYIPFVTNPNFARTGQYLIQGRLGGGGQGLLSWSGTAVWQMVTFYNSSYFIIGLILLLSVGTLALARQRRGATPLLYFLTPLLFYLFIVADPRTHVYTFFPGAVILAAYGAVVIGDWRLQIGGYSTNKFKHSPQRFFLLLPLRPLRSLRLNKFTNLQSPISNLLFLLFWLVAATYVYLLFIDHTPERQRTWAENRPFGYPTTWQTPPQFGLFGFPHQAGWRLAAQLIDELPYAANEEEEITNWYMAQAARTHCPNFQTFVLTANTQDEIPYDPTLLNELFLQHEVQVNGRSALKIYSRTPTSTPQTHEASHSSRWLTPSDVAPPRLHGSFPLNVVFGEQQVRLLGYDLDSSQAHPGGQVVVTLYWEALAPFDQNYQVFVHLTGSEPQPVAQHDGAPECNINPTTRWETGQIIPDPHLIPLPAELEETELGLTVGLYNLVTLERLWAQETAVFPPTDALPLTTIRIR